MQLSDIQTNPETTTLRQFAGLWIVFFAAAGGYQWLGGSEISPWYVIGAAIGLGAAGQAFPRLLKPIFVAWICLVFPVGWIVSHLLLLAIFLLVLTPIGLILRMLGHDPLRLSKPTGKSYWNTKTQQTDLRRYLKQF